MKTRIIETISNNIYILKFVKKASPFFIILSILVTLTAFVDTVSNTWLSKIVFDGMVNRTDYIDILVTVFVLFGFIILSNVLKTWYYQRKTLISNEKIKLYMRTLLLKKTRKLDLECFENAEFYNSYTRALYEAENRVFGVLQTFTGLSYTIISLFTLFAIIIYLDPILIVFAVIGAVLTVVINISLGKLRYQYDYERTPLDRNTAYIHRIYYEPQYVKDLKMDNMYTYFANLYKGITKSIIALIKKKTTKIAVLEFLVSSSNIILQVIMIVFLTYRVFNGYILHISATSGQRFGNIRTA